MASVSSRSNLFKTISEVGSLPQDDVEFLAKGDNTQLVGKHVAEIYKTFIEAPDARRTQEISQAFFARQTPETLAAFRKGLRTIKKLTNKDQMVSVEPILKFIFDMSKSTPAPTPVSHAQTPASVVGQSAGGSSRLQGPVREEPIRWVKLEDGRVIKESDLAKRLGIPVDHPSILMRRAMAETTPVTASGNSVKELDGTEHKTQDHL